MNVAAITSSMSSAANLGADLRPPVDKSPAAERKKVGEQFEAIMVRQLLGKSIGSMLGGTESTAGSVYGDIMTDVFAQKLTSGQGLGLGRMIEQQLTPHAARVTTPAAVAKSVLK